MEETNEIITTRNDLVKAVKENILSRFTSGFNKKMKQLAENPSGIRPGGSQQVFISELKLPSLSGGLRNDIETVLRNTFGFKKDEILDITLSSNETPCIIVYFKLNEI